MKLGKVSSQVILKPLFAMFGCPLTVLVSGFTHNPALLAVSEFKMAGSAELVDLAETEDASRKPIKTKEFSPQVTQFFNIMGFLEVFRSFYNYRIFRGETGDF